MRICGLLAACVSLMLWSSSGPAQDSGAARERLAVRICAADISARCHGVEGGQGGLRSCVKAHLADFSQGCQARLARLAAVRKACAADIKQNCPASKGPRRIVACLKSALAKLSDACRNGLAQSVARAPP
jgi:cysteine rich repeat protein